MTHRSIPEEVKFSFNRKGKDDRCSVLTTVAIINGYKEEVFNDDLHPEPKYYQCLTSQGTLAPSRLMNTRMKERKRV